MNTETILFALLRSEVCGRELSEDIKREIDADRIEALYRLAKHHDMAHLVCYTLMKHALLPTDSPYFAKFQKQQMLAVYRYQRIRYEIDALSRKLEEKRIPFILLKGCVIRSYYPEPWMRTSSDIDMLVHPEDVPRVIELVTTEMSYRFDWQNSHEAALFHENGVHLDLHSALIGDDDPAQFNEVLLGVWDHAKPAEQGSAQYLLDDAFYYFFHFAHMASHFLKGGCGIRPFLDLWLLEHRVTHDDAMREALLEKGRLLTFARKACKLSDAWFADGETDEVTEQMKQYILYGGVYGTIQNRISVKQGKKGGKLRYALSRIFQPYDEIKYYYPILQKHRWLTPLYQVRRWFRIVFKGRFKASVHELNVNRTMSKEQNESTAELLSKLEL